MTISLKLGRIATVGALAGLLVTSSCIQGPDADAVDYGPEEKITDIADALDEATKGMSPMMIEVGEFFAVEQTQELAGGAAFTILSDSAATIMTKTETAEKVVYGGVLHEATYQNGSVSKVSREGNLLCISKVAGACGEETIVSSAYAAIKVAQANVQKLRTEKVAALAQRETYHRLTKSTAVIPAPARVRNRPNCGGLPDCEMKIYRVGFDQVVWEDGQKPTRVHVDSVSSSDVPYLSRNLSTCYTAVVQIASTSSSVLVKQCSNVFDFRFREEP